MALFGKDDTKAKTKTFSAKLPNGVEVTASSESELAAAVAAVGATPIASPKPALEPPPQAGAPVAAPGQQTAPPQQQQAQGRQRMTNEAFVKGMKEGQIHDTIGQVIGDILGADFTQAMTALAGQTHRALTMGQSSAVAPVLMSKGIPPTQRNIASIHQWLQSQPVGQNTVTYENVNALVGKAVQNQWPLERPQQQVQQPVPGQQVPQQLQPAQQPQQIPGQVQQPIPGQQQFVPQQQVAPQAVPNPFAPPISAPQQAVTYGPDGQPIVGEAQLAPMAAAPNQQVNPLGVVQPQQGQVQFVDGMEVPPGMNAQDFNQMTQFFSQAESQEIEQLYQQAMTEAQAPQGIPGM